MQEETSILQRSGEEGSLIRVYTFGPLTLEWKGQTSPFPNTRLVGRGVAPALGLLKALLSQPHRFASRDWLLEQFWPDSATSSAQQRLDDVASGLRTLLRPPGSAAKILHYVYGTNGSGSGYRLEDYPLMWVDADAFSWYIEQAARLERFGQPSVGYWERAYQLASRGSFLVEEPYSDWATARRREVEGQYRQCVHRLSTLLREIGAREEALLRLRSYWQEHVTDQDVLRPLMELLGEQERYQEAEESYQQLLLALSELGPDNDGEPRRPDPRTDDIREVLRAQQIRRKRSLLHSAEGDKSAVPLTSPDHAKQSEAFVYFSGVLPQSTLEEAASTLQDSLLQRMLASKRTPTSSSTSPLTAPPLSHFVAFDSAQPLCIDETTSEALEHFAALTNACRHLSEGNELQTAERTLWAYLPRVETIAKLSFEDQEKAADIASQGYLLAASLAGHRNDLQARHRHSEQALLYGKLAGGRNLQIAALRQLSITFDYLGRPDKVLQIYQQAFPYLDEVSPLLRACVYAGVSGASAQLQRKPEAFDFMRMAYEQFPAHPEYEVGFLHTICRYSTLVFFDGLNHLYLGQPDEAEKVLAQIDGLNPVVPGPERVRIEALNYQIEVFVALNAVKQACTYLEAAVQAALAIGSERRLQESFALFQRMKEKWRNEPQIRALTEMFVR